MYDPEKNKTEVRDNKGQVIIGGGNSNNYQMNVNNSQSNELDDAKHSLKEKLDQLQHSIQEVQNLKNQLESFLSNNSVTLIHALTKLQKALDQDNELPNNKESGKLEILTEDMASDLNTGNIQTDKLQRFHQSMVNAVPYLTAGSTLFAAISGVSDILQMSLNGVK